jgi:DnaJ-class molecular chaperone
LRPLFEATRDVDVEAIAQEKQSRRDEVELHRELAQELIDIGYKALATRLHPDRGGSKDAMARLNRVREELKDVAATRRFV